MQKYRFEFYIGHTNHAGKKIGFIDTWEEERYIIPNTGRSSREMAAWNKWWNMCKEIEEHDKKAMDVYNKQLKEYRKSRMALEATKE